MESSTYKYEMEQTLIATICPHSTTNQGCRKQSEYEWKDST